MCQQGNARYCRIARQNVIAHVGLHKKMKKILGKFILIGAGFSLLACLFITFGGFGMRCWWNPWISTRCSYGFSEKEFDSITKGMTKIEVFKVLGKPLKIHAPNAKCPPEIWQYTSAGECKWADWAWLERLIGFDENGKVISKQKRICN